MMAPGCSRQLTAKSKSRLRSRPSQSLDSTLRLFIKSLPLQMSTRGKRNLSKMSYCKTLNNCQQKIIRKLPLNIFAEVKPIMMSTEFGTAVQFSVKLCCDF